MNYIIQTLKKYPNRNINQISLMLNISPLEVAEVQREYYKPFLKRDSPLWGSKGGVLTSRESIKIR